MAIPADLNKVWVSGVYRDPTGANPGDIWEWSQVFHVKANVNLPGFPIETSLTALANHKLNLYADGGLFGPCGDGMICTQRGAVNLATGSEAIIDQDIDLQKLTTVNPLPSAVCAFIFARTSTLGRQTRKWVPGIRADLWLGEQAFFDTGETALGVSFFSWAGALLAPTNIFPVGPISDVVWDPKDEVMREIESAWLSKYPRTKGSRQLAGVEQYDQLF